MSIDKLIKNAKFLIFDFDGTIADTSLIHEKAFKKVFEPFFININYQKYFCHSLFPIFNICKISGKPLYT